MNNPTKIVLMLSIVLFASQTLALGANTIQASLATDSISSTKGDNTPASLATGSTPSSATSAAATTTISATLGSTSSGSIEVTAPQSFSFNPFTSAGSWTYTTDSTTSPKVKSTSNWQLLMHGSNNGKLAKTDGTYTTQTSWTVKGTTTITLSSSDQLVTSGAQTSGAFTPVTLIYTMPVTATDLTHPGSYSIVLTYTGNAVV